MRELAEFRIPEAHAQRLLQSDEGVCLGGSVRKIVVDTNSPRFREIGASDEMLRAEQSAFFTAWIIRRRYSAAELNQAECFQVKFLATFEPAGEECGTKYDESTACPNCGAGGRQVTPLYLPEKRIPKSKDFSQTIAGEIVVSRRVKEAFTRHNVIGAEFSHIRTRRGSDSEFEDWFQLTVPSTTAEIIAPTRIGNDPFDDDAEGKYRCPLGDLLGLNLLSEVYIARESLPDADVVCTRQFVGARRGLLRPERVLAVSQKVRRLVESEKLKGVELEVAHLL